MDVVEHSATQTRCRDSLAGIAGCAVLAGIAGCAVLTGIAGCAVLTGSTRRARILPYGSTAHTIIVSAAPMMAPMATKMMADVMLTLPAVALSATQRGDGDGGGGGGDAWTMMTVCATLATASTSTPRAVLSVVVFFAASVTTAVIAAAELGYVMVVWTTTEPAEMSSVIADGSTLIRVARAF